MKIRQIPLLALFATVFLFTGCGGSSSGGSSSQSSQSSSLSSASSSSESPSSQSSSSDSSSTFSSSSSIVSGPSVIYEAEDNFYSGGVTNTVTDSESYLQHFSAPGARVIFTVNNNSAGTYAVALNYANDSGSDKTLNVYVNGLNTLTTNLAPTDGENTWAEKVEMLNLRLGVNTISYQYDADNTGNVNINHIDIPGGIELAVRGATHAYDEYEAEAGDTNGEISAFSTAFPSVAAESSGRQFVALTATGDYVQWTSEKTANALVVRYNTPDAANGGGADSTLSLYVNDVKVKTLNLSSRYQWTYGTAWPFMNDNPSGGNGHHFYDESHFTDLNIPAGANVKLQRDADDNAAYYNIDFIDLEQIEPAYTMPENFVSVTTYGGAIANDDVDDTQAITNTITYAKQMNMGVWIPAGTFNLNSRLNNINDVHIRGAGMWYTRLQGVNGQGGFYATGGNVTLADMLIASDSIYRDNGGHTAGIEGNFGTGSLIQNVWIEHMKVGAWFLPGTDGLYMVHGRVRNTWADGINLHSGVINSTISHFNVRNNGDDSLAMWSLPSEINRNNSFRFLTAQVPVLANTFAIYGGENNKVLDSIGSDTVRAAAGIAVSTRKDFPGGTANFSGTTEVKRNTLNRTGGWESNWNTSFGAIWIYADGFPISVPIVIEDVTLNDSTYDGILMSYNQSITNLSVQNVQINGAGTYGINIAGISGSGAFSGVTITDAQSGGLNNGGSFVITEGEGNSGW